MNPAAHIAYLGASTLFIVGLKGLTHPRTAIRGNKLAAAAMLIVVGGAFVETGLAHIPLVAAALVIGAVVGMQVARRVRMTSMPQLVAAFNGLGGLASAFVALVQMRRLGVESSPSTEHATLLATAGIAVAIGSLAATGSVVAFVKLHGWKWSPRNATAWRILNVVGLAAVAAMIALSCVAPTGSAGLTVLLLAAVVGLTTVACIGGADMPVVIALLNSLSGVAAAAAGFSIQNVALVVSGSLVGASGLLLTNIMCKAMNRNLLGVLFGAKTASPGASQAGITEEVQVKETCAEEVALILESARTVMVVPGYGMAVAQAQHAVRDLARALTQQGVQVSFAIHPVAGRMPGHMNVLLAEVDIPYDAVLDMEAANARFAETDVAIVIGANDVCNPCARQSVDSPLAGMPILDVDRARVVVAIKRSLSPGFAGVANPLFSAANTAMLFGDAKRAVHDVVSHLSES